MIIKMVEELSTLSQKVVLKYSSPQGEMMTHTDIICAKLKVFI